MHTDPPNESKTPAAPGFSLHVDDLGVAVANTGRELLKEITLTVKPGEFVCILGPSGSGKTTLVRTLIGQLPPSRGEIRFGSLRVSGDTRTLAGLVGYVPQKDIVHESLPARRALHYAAKLRLPPSLGHSEVAGRIAQIAKDVGISHRMDTPVGRLSGGEAKRVGLAVELLGLPPVLIVDEATSSLDPASDARIMKLLADYAKSHNITVLCVTHHLENAKLADRLVMLAAGRLVWSGGAEEALEHFGGRSLSEIYVLLEDLPVEQWVGLHKVYQHQERAGGASATQHDTPPMRRSERPGWFREFGALFLRGLEVLVRDRRSVAFLIAVPLIMVVLGYAAFSGESFNGKTHLTRPLEPREIQLVGQLWGHTQAALAIKDKIQGADIPAQIRMFLDKEPPIKERLETQETAETIKQALAGDLSVVPTRQITNPWPTWQLRFTVMFGILILGFLAGLMEIVKERPVLERESANGVRMSSYTASKFALLGVVLAMQVFAGVYMLQAVFEVPELLGGAASGASSPLGSTVQFVSLTWLAGMVCAGIGLAVSGLVKSREQALLVFPVLILPQLLFGGILIKLRGGFLTTIAELVVPAFWAFRGSIEYVVADPPVPLFDIGHPYTAWQAATALGLQMLVVWLAAYFLLSRSLRQKSRIPSKS
ncbi:MAG: hypothetical protein RI897_1594 [Verrucomicrobiota bacterium]|jgi:ABC-type multidrug transport system ATPase subunit